MTFNLIWAAAAPCALHALLLRTSHTCRPNVTGRSAAHRSLLQLAGAAQHGKRGTESNRQTQPLFRGGAWSDGCSSLHAWTSSKASPCFDIRSSMQASTCTVKLSPCLSAMCRSRRISPICAQRCLVRVCSLCHKLNSSSGILDVYRLRQWVHSSIRLLRNWLRVGLEQLPLEHSPFKRAGTLVLWMHSHCSCTPSAGPSGSIR